MANPTPVTIKSRKATTGATFGFTAATGSAQNIPWMNGGELIAHNTHETDAKTITVVNNPKNSRDSNTIGPVSLAAGQYWIAPRLGPQDNNVLVTTGESTDIELAVLDTHPQPS